jgi:hypothetical protein
VAEGVQQWLGGYRATGRRRLEEAEVRALIERVQRELRPLRRAHLVSRWATALIALAIGTYFILRPDERPVITVFAALGAMMMVLGPLGALLEIAFAPRLPSRIFFAAAALVTAVAAWCERSSGRELGPWGTIALFSGFALGVGGLVALGKRWRSRPARMQTLGTAVADAHRGEVLVFEPASPAAPPDPEHEEGPEDEEPMALRIEVLPMSRIIYRTDEVLGRYLHQASVVSVGIAETGGGGPGTSRDLAPSEREELAREYARFRRRGISRVIWVTWLTALVLRAFETILRGHFDPRLSGASWVLTLACAVGLTVRRVRWQRRLAADLRAARVERVSGAPGSGAVREILPISRLPWSVDGYPAPWRMGIQD